MRSLPARRLRLSLAAAACLVPMLSGCGRGFDAPTLKVYQAGQGANDRSGEVDVLGAVVVTDGGGIGRLVVGLANNNTTRADALTAVTPAPGQADVTASIGAGTATLSGGGFLQLANPDAAEVTVSGPAVVAGTYVRLVLTFAQARQISVNVPVVPKGPDFDGVTLPTAPATPAPTPSATPSPS